MSGQWRSVSVDDIKADKPNAISIGPFGSRLKSNLYTPSGVPVIRGTNVSDSRDFSGAMVFVAGETADMLRVSNVFPGDLVFPIVGL